MKSSQLREKTQSDSLRKKMNEWLTRTRQVAPQPQLETTSYKLELNVMAIS